MLNPNSRSIYIDALRPPEGYQLHWAVGTTFSLDLLSLLIIPMSMALYDYSGEEDVTVNPIAILDAVRNMADRFVLFCQSGRISIPRKDTRLFNFLEQSVIETHALTDTGVFHPKTWLLKFTGTQTTDEVLYRFICLSRNLTFDRSWDTILTLEGKLKTERRVAYSRNHPLGDFIKSLPRLTNRNLTTSQREHINEMSDEVRRVDFLPPPGFKNEISFIPMGIPGYQSKRKIDPMRHMLIVSPFLSEEVFTPLQKTGLKNTIISRFDSFESLSNEAIVKMETHSDLYYVDNYAEVTEPDDENITALSNENDVKGLHAKLYIAEKGWDSIVSTGSANATNAAYAGNNVEFLVRLKGPKSRFGIEAFLNGGNSQGSFREFLCQYQREDDHTEIDPEEANLDELLEETRRKLSKGDLSVVISPSDTDSYDMSISSSKDHIYFPEEVTVTCYPISLPESDARNLSELNTTGSITFSDLSIVSLTGFIAFRLTAKLETKTMSISFVLNLPISGLPEDRNSFVITNVINNSRNFIRYLLLILSSDPNHVINSFIDASQGDGANKPNNYAFQAIDDIPLFEELLRATSRHPEKIEQIASLIDEIKRINPEQDIFPDGFDKIWSAITLGMREE